MLNVQEIMQKIQEAKKGLDEASQHLTPEHTQDLTIPANHAWTHFLALLLDIAAGGEGPELDEAIERVAAAFGTTPDVVRNGMRELHEIHHRDEILEAVEQLQTPFDPDALREILRAVFPLSEVYQARVRAAIIAKTGLGKRELARIWQQERRTWEAEIAAQAEAEDPKPARAGRPLIETDDLAKAYKAAADLIAADAASGKPTLFERGGELAAVGEEHDPASGARVPRIVPMTPATMEVWLAERADWVRETKTGTARVTPPRVLAEALVAAPAKPAAPLKYVSRVPVVTEAGVHAEPGYQPATKVYYWPHPKLANADLRPDPKPSGTAVRRAAELLLDDYLGDFPFADQTSRANALGLLLEPVCRALFRPPSPLWAVDAPQAGSGKTLLAQALLLPGVGHVVPVRSLPVDETEAGKVILALLLGGQRAVIFDNANNATVKGDALEAVLTAPAYEGRILGQSRTARAPNLTTWVLTGNNMLFGGTMARRVVPIRIDPRVEEPWARTGFRHAPLLAWAEEHLAELVRATLTLIQAWIAAGRPEDPSPATVMGSYESWQAVIGGILYVAGVKGFLGNRDELVRSADPEAEEWRALVEAWWEQHADKLVGAREVARIAADRGLLGRVIRADDPASPAVASRMGYALRRMAGRVVGGRIVVRDRDSHNGAAVFRLVTAVRQEEPPEEPEDWRF